MTINHKSTGMHMNHYGNAVDREFDPLSGKNIDYLIV